MPVRISRVSTAGVVLLRGVEVAKWAADERSLLLLEQRSASPLRLAVLLTGNRVDAEDVVQDVLISVAHAWPRVRPATAHADLRRAVRYSADLPDAEIARARRCSTMTVRSQAHHALATLRAAHPAMSEEDGR